MKAFKFKSWHFVVMLIVFTTIITLWSEWDIKNTPDKIEDSCCKELDDKTFNTSVSNEICYVLFYREDSELCKKMEYNLNRQSNNDKNILYFKLDIEKFPAYVKSHQISGVPSTLVFNKGEEIERILGIVSESALNNIHNRIFR